MKRTMPTRDGRCIGVRRQDKGQGSEDRGVWVKLEKSGEVTDDHSR